MNSYRFDITCPECAGPLDHRETGDHGPTYAQAETWCAACLIVFRIDVSILPVVTMADLFEPSDLARRTRAADAAGIY